MSGPDTWAEATPEHVVEYVRGRISAAEYDAEKLKTQRADRRYQIAGNIRTELARMRWALGHFDGHGQDNKILPDYVEFARRILDAWHDGWPPGLCDIQEIGEATGLLVPRTMAGPCTKPDEARCVCAEALEPDDWPTTCWRNNIAGEVIDPRALKKYGGEA